LNDGDQGSKIGCHSKRPDGAPKKITRQCTALVLSKFHLVCVQLFLQGCLDKLQIACINSPACSPEHEREVQEHC